MAPIALSPERAAPQLDSLAINFDDTIRFYLNGTRVVLDEVDPEVTLLEYLRGIGLTGTKLYVLIYFVAPYFKLGCFLSINAPPPQTSALHTDCLPAAAQRAVVVPVRW